MMKNKNLSKLHEKREALRRQLSEQRMRIDHRLQEIKRSVAPIIQFLPSTAPVADQLRRPDAFETGLKLAAMAVPFLLRRDPRTRLLVDLALPLAIKHLPRAASYLRHRTPAFPRARVLGFLKKRVKRLRLKLRRVADAEPGIEGWFI